MKGIVIVRYPQIYIDETKKNYLPNLFYLQVMTLQKVGLCQDCPLSLILLRVFMDRISRCCCEK